MIFQIQDKLISSEVITEYFVCDLDKCLGACCIEGDSGAVVTTEESLMIEELFPKIKNLLKPESQKLIEETWFCIEDQDGDLVTPCNEDGSCVYLINENGNNLCVFEKLYRQKESNFVKPISCHLFPIRLKKINDYTAINIQKRNICKAAFIKGKQLNIKVYEFLKEAIIRQFSEDFYNELNYIAQNYQNLQ